MRFDIIPRVDGKEIGSETIEIRNIRFSNALKDAVPVADDVFAYYGYSVNGKKPVTYSADGSLADEEYYINASHEEISIKASTDKGAFYAVCTLAQLFSINDGKISQFELTDKPEKSFRGASDDISRGQISTSDGFKSIIRRLALLKYNVYMPYMEDTFKYSFSPDLGKYSDPVEASEWKDIVAYAKNYHVSVRPIFNTLSHWDKCSMLEDFRDLMLTSPKRGENETEILAVLDPRKPEVRELLCNMLDELVDCFGKGIIHVGGDDPCEMIETLGREESARLFAEHYAWLNGEVRKRGCEMMIYADAFNMEDNGLHIKYDALSEIGDAIYVCWDREPRESYPSFEKLKTQTNKIVAADGGRDGARFIPLSRLEFDNAKSLAKASKDVWGHISSSRNDKGFDLRESNFLGWSFGAQFAWKYDEDFNYDEAMASYFEFMFGIRPDKEHINAIFDYTGGEYDPSEVSYQMTMEFFKDGRTATSAEFNLPPLASELYGPICEAAEYLDTLTVTRNDYAFRCFKFDIRRLICAFMRIFVIPTEPFRSREEAMGYVDDIIAIADEYTAIKKENKKLWLEQNRASEWSRLESMYIDVEESLYSLARFCRFFLPHYKDKRTLF